MEKLHPIAIGKLINDEYPNYKHAISKIEKAGRTRIKILFTRVSQANNFVQTKFLGNYRCYSPEFAIVRSGLVRGVDTSLSEDHLVQTLDGKTSLYRVNLL